MHKLVVNTCSRSKDEYIPILAPRVLMPNVGILSTIFCLMLPGTGIH